jgi:hypothetical protein
MALSPEEVKQFKDTAKSLGVADSKVAAMLVIAGMIMDSNRSSIEAIKGSS